MTYTMTHTKAQGANVYDAIQWSPFCEVTLTGGQPLWKGALTEYIKT